MTHKFLPFCTLFKCSQQRPATWVTEMILQVLSIIFMSKVDIDKAAFDIRVFFWGRENIFLLFCARVPLFDTGLWDALEVNPVRRHYAAAKVGHCPKQIHFWNYWIQACASVYALAKSMALDPEKSRVFKWPIYCRLLQEAFRSVFGLCVSPPQERVCLPQNSHLTEGSVLASPGQLCSWDGPRLCSYVRQSLK